MEKNLKLLKYMILFAILLTLFSQAGFAVLLLFLCLVLTTTIWWRANPEIGGNQTLSEEELIIQLCLYATNLKKTISKNYGSELKPQDLENQESTYLTIKIGEQILAVRLRLGHINFATSVKSNVSDVRDQEDYEARIRAAAFIGTLQAGYTDFHYLRQIWKKTTEKDALIGVSMTGIGSAAVLQLDMKAAAKITLAENARVAKLLGIKKAARTTTVKPAGTTSLTLGTSSGIHAWHNDYYIRRLRVGKNEAIYTYLEINHPELIEDEFF